ncbi:PAS domain S-box protein [Clostridium sp. DJ247]|uniref:sensor histidine kinase n=1 Tax=Clostridium sp. DJ247 TaxID=2726188 RepID=UPI00162A071B|nr:PAS domain S-box protein [Clostridium sp. DJ247]MBC2582614.1 PAS domain S-box protein [Clostridium sp. DJ247]
MLKVDKYVRDSLIADSISQQTWEYDLITSETNIVDSLVNFLGYSKFEIRDHIDFWFTLVHPDDIEGLTNTFNEIIKGKKDYFKAEYRIKSKDNKYMWIKSNGKALKDEQGRNVYVAGLHLDIRPYKQQEETEETEQKYQTLFNNVNDIILLADIKKDGTTGKFIEVNTVATETLGYSKEEFLDMIFDDIYIHNEYLKIYGRSTQNISDQIKEDRKLHSYTFETALLKKDKTILPVEINANVFRLNKRLVKLCVIRDISERLKSEEALMEITERNKKIIDLSPLGVYVVNNGIITYANKPGLKLFGAKSSEEVVGRSRLDFITDPYHKKAVNRETLTKNGCSIEPVMEMELLKIDGTKIVCEVFSAPLSSKDNLLGLTYINDITEQKRIIEENKKFLQQTIEYDRLKTEFFSNISHELRTPLNIILSAIQLLNSIHNSSKGNCNNFTAAFEKYIGIMRQNAHRLLKLINNIIDLTKIDSGFSNINLDNHNIVAVVEDITLSVVDYVKSKEIELIFDTDTEEKIIACDDDKIERIMLNLLSNAIKHTKSGGTINVHIKDLDANVMISVKDTGVGIPADKLDIIFERFRQVDELLTRKVEGSGIGLSLVKSLVEAHGGSISVKSTLGVGSEFVILLPSKTIENSEESYRSLDTIHNDDQLQKKTERIGIEFSDIYK